MPKSDFTVAELVAFLRHSDKPNIVVEGDDDATIYRQLAERFGLNRGDILQTGGREKLLLVYDEISGYESKGDFSHGPVVFIADRDMWLFRGIPTRYEGIIWTNGYSIENDLYSSARLRSRVGNQRQYDQVLDSISTWFAFKVEEYLEKNPPPPTKVFLSLRDEEPVAVGLHCSKIVPVGGTTLASGLESLSLSHQRVKEIRGAYHLQLRGKLIFQLLHRFLNNPDQGFQKALINYDALYNEALSRSDELFSRLEKAIQEKLDAKQQEIAEKKYVQDPTPTS